MTKKKNERGIQPVRVLPYNIMDWFLNITPSFANEYQYEIDSNGLKEQILYKVPRQACLPHRMVVVGLRWFLFHNF